MFSSRNKKNIMWIPPLICSYAGIIQYRHWRYVKKNPEKSQSMLSVCIKGNLPETQKNCTETFWKSEPPTLKRILSFVKQIKPKLLFYLAFKWYFKSLKDKEIDILIEIMVK